MINTSAPTFDEADLICQTLKKHQESFFPVLGEKFPEDRICLIDLSNKNLSLSLLKYQETEVLHEHIFSIIEEKGALAGAGGYLENRIIYSRSNVFSGVENRSIHLGIDLWAPAFTPVFAPMEGTIHSIRDNIGHGDYGPTIILEHELENIKFFTLYGHLSRRSLQGLIVGQSIEKGTLFTELGPFPENGDWPPHLHFQLMLDLQGKIGDYPGVAAPSEQLQYRANCPDPNLILNLSVLKIENGIF